MKMPENFASSIQDLLYLTSLDGYCPDLFLGGRPETITENSHQLWRNAVELIYRCLVRDLLRLDANWSQAMQMSDPASFANALAQHDPFDTEEFKGGGATYWLDPLLYATERTRKLLAQYNVNALGAGLRAPFAAEIAEIFDREGFLWDKDFGLFTK